MLWIVLLLVVGPLAELWFIIRTAQVIGGWETIALLFVMGVVGGWLIRRQGRSVLDRIDQRLKADELPTKELADGFLLLVAGVLMLAPGFLSDAVGILLLLPPTRALARTALLARFAGRLGTGITFIDVGGAGGFGARRRGATVYDTTVREPGGGPDPSTPTSLGPGER